jgi:transposase
MIYQQVHQLSRSGFSARAISTQLGLNWRTVKRLLSIEDDRQYEQYLQSVSDKHRVLEPYESFVKSRLELYRDTSAAQMHDWLKEHFTGFPSVSPRTVFNFVMWIRQKYQLPKLTPTREYGMVAETPYGEQAQVDFGEYSLRNGQGRRVKVYFFVLVLSRSRYKFVHFSTERFSADTAIDAHERAFAFLEGIALVIVYDQDRVFLVDENSGDLLLTEAFKNYRQLRGFKLHFCRKSDPESKGKVENSVRYIKQNFLYNRVFTDIDLLNSEAQGWLARTANALPHNTTRKVPAAEWVIEKTFLRPWQAVTLPKPKLTEYTVRKDNSFSYKGNFYSLPAGTYRGRGSKVLLDLQGAHIVVFSTDHHELCRHLLSQDRGTKVIDRQHRRLLSPAIAELEERFYSKLANSDQGKRLVAAIRSDKPRYIRDQLQILLDTSGTYPPAVIEQALHYCCEHGIASAGDFKAVASHYHRQSAQVTENHFLATLRLNPLSRSLPDEALIQPATSSITDYSLF